MFHLLRHLDCGTYLGVDRDEEVIAQARAEWPLHSFAVSDTVTGADVIVAVAVIQMNAEKARRLVHRIGRRARVAAFVSWWQYAFDPAEIESFRWPGSVLTLPGEGFEDFYSMVWRKHGRD